MGPQITEIARTLSMEKFYSTVAKMQKKRMTTPKLWASFRPQNRQGAKISAKFAVKSWEDQIFGARRRCHRTTDRDHAIPVKQGFQPCFFLLFANGIFFSTAISRRSMRQRRTAASPCGTPPHVGRGNSTRSRGFPSPKGLCRRVLSLLFAGNEREEYSERLRATGMACCSPAGYR